MFPEGCWAALKIAALRITSATERDCRVLEIGLLTKSFQMIILGERVAGRKDEIEKLTS